MPDLATKLEGRFLELASYREEFQRRFDRQTHSVSWKFERRQTFRQPSSPSWKAFSEGDWATAVRKLEENRPRLTAMFEEMAGRDFVLRRVRVVEEPVTPYLHWELHSLRVRAQCGEQIRVVPSDSFRQLEINHELPETITIGEEGLFEIAYDSTGVLTGGTWVDDRDTLANWVHFTRTLYESGEPLLDHFDRSIKDLPPPAGQD
ncbi:MAG: hypothetical protein HOV94_02390 [Saccharothrix sp.]|nr:hypothetical protein [Saccharothrix sp.]